jgi:drug/metabolite transporter (DMT)-like permease
VAEHVSGTSGAPGAGLIANAKHRGNHRSVVGWVLAVASGILFTANNFSVKQLGMNAAEVMLVRSALQATLLGLTLSSSGGSLDPGPGARLPVALQGLCCGACVLLQLACLSHLPLGDALTLIFSEPLWTLFLARLLLGTRISPWKMGCCAVLFTGMLLCIQPPVIFGPGGGRPGNTTGASYYLGVRRGELGGCPTRQAWMSDIPNGLPIQQHQQYFPLLFDHNNNTDDISRMQEWYNLSKS